MDDGLYKVWIARCLTYRTSFYTLCHSYQPTFVWGKSGHFQTVIHVKMGRVKPKWPDSERFHLTMPDGATMSYDLFEPHMEGIKGKTESYLQI